VTFENNFFKDNQLVNVCLTWDINEYIVYNKVIFFLVCYFYQIFLYMEWLT